MKKRIWSLAALVLFFALQLYFFHFEYNLSGGDVVIFSGMLFFLVFYVAVMLDCPNIVPGIISICGVLALCFLAHVRQNDDSMDDLVALTYLPVCLFLIAQSAALQKKPSKTAASVWLALFSICPLLLLGVFIYVLLKFAGIDLSLSAASLNFTIALFLLLIVLYLLVMRTPIKKTKSCQNTALCSQKSLFINAVIVLTETALIAVFYDHMILDYTVPLLWFLNLMILYEWNHPLVCAFTARSEAREKHFLESD